MAFSFDIGDEEVRVWSRTGAGVSVYVDETYTPTMYVAGSDEQRSWLVERLDSNPKVAGLETGRRRTSLRDREGSLVLRVDVKHPSEVRTVGAGDSNGVRAG